MSSWVRDWNGGSFPRVMGANGEIRTAKVRTNCKLGGHFLLDGDPSVWLTAPMGLSCFPCAESAGQGEAVALERLRSGAPVQAAPATPPPGQRWKHGTSYGYTKKGCRCDPCTDANNARSQRYREKVRQRVGAAA